MLTSMGAQSAYSPRLGPFERLNESRPILSPQGGGFEANGVFNPAVIKDGDRFVMLYRAQDTHGISRLGYATSQDGIAFVREPAPVLSPEAEYERGGGVEDPRLVKIDGLYYLTYTAYNGKDAQLALATSRDLRRWERKGVILPGLQRPLERELDEGRCDPPPAYRRAVLDVLHGRRQGRARPDRYRLLDRLAQVDGGVGPSGAAPTSRPVRFASR